MTRMESIRKQYVGTATSNSQTGGGGGRPYQPRPRHRFWLWFWLIVLAAITIGFLTNKKLILEKVHEWSGGEKEAAPMGMALGAHQGATQDAHQGATQDAHQGAHLGEVVTVAAKDPVVAQYFQPSEAELAQLFEYVRSAANVKENLQYASIMKDVRFFYLADNDTVNAYAAFPIAETAALAHPLQKVVKNYKITTRENYMKESALLDNLLQDLAPFTDQLRALGLLAIYEGLRNANDKVRHILTSRNDERSELVLGELKAARAEADQAYAAVVFFTNAYLAMNLDSQSALALVKHISEDLDYFRQHAMSKPNSNRDSQPEGETAPQDGEEAANA